MGATFQDAKCFNNNSSNLIMFILLSPACGLLSEVNPRLGIYAKRRRIFDFLICGNKAAV